MGIGSPATASCAENPGVLTGTSEMLHGSSEGLALQTDLILNPPLLLRSCVSWGFLGEQALPHAF